VSAVYLVAAAAARIRVVSVLPWTRPTSAAIRQDGTGQAPRVSFAALSVNGAAPCDESRR